jgi:predicted nucleic acid-binding protein
VLARPRLRKYLSTEEAARFLADLAAQTTLLADPTGPAPAVCRDPRDDYLVALARYSGAEAIVTGDLDLLAIDPGPIQLRGPHAATAHRPTELVASPSHEPRPQPD